MLKYIVVLNDDFGHPSYIMDSQDDAMKYAQQFRDWKCEAKVYKLTEIAVLTRRVIHED